MRRLALLLLVLLLAVPAAAAPHCAPQPAVSSHQEGGHHQDAPDAPAAADLSVIHGCIGCAAPCRSVEAAPEPHAAAPLPLAARARRLANRHLIPDPPPPRRLG